MSNYKKNYKKQFIEIKLLKKGIFTCQKYEHDRANAIIGKAFAKLIQNDKKHEFGIFFRARRVFTGTHSIRPCKILFVKIYVLVVVMRTIFFYDQCLYCARPF